MYRKMLEIRYFEEKVAELFETGLLSFASGFIHLYVGEEAVAVGVCSALRKDDCITSTHRGHGHCIAKGARLDKVMAEIFGKEVGYCKGRGGSMHLSAPDLGIIGCSGIVGAGIPQAVGVGLSSKLKGTGQVCVSFFGDGASNTGAFHEGLNLAAIWKVPVIFVCENNLYGITMPYSASTSVKNIADRSAAYGIPGVMVDGMDVLAVYNAASEAVKRARDGLGPTCIECKTYRFRGHMEGEQFTFGKERKYRSEEEIEEWMKRDPIPSFRKKLIEIGILREKEANEIELEVRQEVEDAAKFAMEAPDPDPGSALEYLFA